MNRRNRTRLKKYLEKDKIPLVLAFLGEDGSGRKTMAYDFVREANCVNKERKTRTCDCVHCVGWADLSHPYLEIYGVQKKLTVNEARTLLKRTVKVPEGVKRFIVIEDMSHASRSAWNALLKSLENPPERTHFLLIGDTKGLPDTIASRCVSLYFGGLENGDLITEIVQDTRCKLVWEKLSKQDKELLLKVSEGSWGRLRGVLSNDSIRKLLLSIVHDFTVVKVKPEFFRAVRDYEELEKNGALPLANVLRILLESVEGQDLIYSKRLSRNLNLDVKGMCKVLDKMGKLWFQRSKVYEYLYLVSR